MPATDATREVPRPNEAPGLYLHLPFCASICPYCDFYVLLEGDDRRRRFLDALEREIGRGAPEGFDAPFDTVYLGGGTPSVLAAEEVGGVLAAAGERLGLAPSPWIGLEANPEDVTPATAAAWRALGVEFLSLGIQSFEPSALDFLGRRHGRERARRAVETALEAGFRTVSIDLIFGLPDQSADAWRRDLETAAALGPHHLSCYQLTVHRHTRFGALRARGELVEAPEGRQAELFRLTHGLLPDLGYAAYEVSNFARSPEHRSRHNTKYWRHTPYLGVGPSAHSFAGRRRWWNLRTLPAWAARLEAGASPVEACEELDDADFALERLMLGLRTPEGVDLDLLEAQTGFDISRLPGNDRRLAALESGGLLAAAGRRLRPTVAGLAVADALARDLAP